MKMDTENKVTKALSAEQKYKLIKWIEGNKFKSALKATRAAEVASFELGFPVSPSSILTHRVIVYPEMRQINKGRVGGGNNLFVTVSELVKRVEKIEHNFQRHLLGLPVE